MTSRLLSGRALAGFGIACAVALSSPILVAGLSAPAQAADEAKAGTVRPELGKPLNAAKTALGEKKYAQALASLKEADAIAAGNKSPTEESLIEQMRLLAGIGAEEPATAAKAFDALAGGGSLTPQQRLQFIQAIAGSYYKAKEYAATATWTNRYFVAGGTDLAMRQLLAQSFYVNNDFGNAVKATNEAIEAYEHAGQQAPESLYLVLMSCGVKQNDKKTQMNALERLVANYPKADYWNDLMHIVAAKGGFPDRLSLDMYRLKYAVGTMSTASDYMEFAELAIQAGLAAEAKAIVDKGYQAGVLGSGQEAERHGRLRDMAKRSMDADQATLGTAEAEAAKAQGGNALVNAGLNFYGYGQFEKAVGLIQQGLAKGDLKNPDDAKLHLGIIYLAAGNKAKALETFKQIKSGDAVNDLARLWVIKAGGRPA